MRIATAYYKLLNEIVLHEEFYGEQAERLQRCFSPGVIELVDDPSQPGAHKTSFTRNQLTNRLVSVVLFCFIYFFKRRQKSRRSKC